MCARKITNIQTSRFIQNCSDSISSHSLRNYVFWLYQMITRVSPTESFVARIRMRLLSDGKDIKNIEIIRVENPRGTLAGTNHMVFQQRRAGSWENARGPLKHKPTKMRPAPPPRRNICKKTGAREHVQVWSVISSYSTRMRTFLSKQRWIRSAAFYIARPCANTSRIIQFPNVHARLLMNPRAHEFVRYASVSVFLPRHHWQFTLGAMRYTHEYEVVSQLQSVRNNTRVNAF